MRTSKVEPKNFTLLELLIVVAILSVLMSVLLPALQKAKSVANEIGCVNNLKQIGVAQMGYSGDYNDWIVPSAVLSSVYWYWYYLLSGYYHCTSGYGVTYQDYDVTKGTFVCPAERTPFGSHADGKYNYTHYAINVWLSGTKTGGAGADLWRPLSALTSPSQAKLATDSKSIGTYAFSNRWAPAYRHKGVDNRTDAGMAPAANSGRSNILYMDNHVDGKSYNDLLNETVPSYPSPFNTTMVNGFNPYKGAPAQ